MFPTAAEMWRKIVCISGQGRYL